MEPLTHNCEDHMEERMATLEKPYHYIGSGLPNVMLSGVKYFVCSLCGKQAAEIPALKELLTAIARTVVEKSTALNGYEIRFLRKRLEKRSLDFAPMIGLTPERLSVVENKGEGVEAARDKLVRLIYSLYSGEASTKKVLSIESSKLEKWLASMHGKGENEIIRARWQRNHQWKVETEANAA